MPFKDLSGKRLAEIDLDETVYLHVAGRLHESTSDFHVASSLREIEGSMRSANSRDNSRFYGPAMCAFAILDQLGSCYARKSIKKPKAQQGFKKGLHYFGGINGDSAEAQHLYAFRNSQVHDAAYAGKDRAGNWYMFQHDEDLPSVIQLPVTAWDGAAVSIGPDTVTFIGRKKLVDLAGEAIRSVASTFWDNRADLVVHPSQPDLLHKYLFWARKPQPEATT